MLCHTSTYHCGEIIKVYVLLDRSFCICFVYCCLNLENVKHSFSCSCSQYQQIWNLIPTPTLHATRQRMRYELGREKTGFLHMRKQKRDQLRGNREADQHLCFRYTDSTIPLLSKSKISSLLPSSVTTARFVWDLVGNPEDRFFHNETCIMLAIPGENLCLGELILLISS